MFFMETNSTEKFSFTPEICEFIKDNCHKYTNKELSEIIGCKSGSLRCKVNSLGLKTKSKESYKIIFDGNKKKCSQCKEIKLLEEFSYINNEPRSSCKKCELIRRKELKDNDVTLKLKKFTKKEEEFLKANYSLYTIQELAEILGRNYSSIFAKLKNLDLPYKKSSSFNEDGTLKKCTYCNEFKPVEDFATRKTGRIEARCKLCTYVVNYEKRNDASLKPYKPSFDEIMAHLKNKKYCTICSCELTESNSLIKP